MKTSKLLLVAAAALGLSLTACNNKTNDEPIVSDGSAYAGLTVSPSLRAAQQPGDQTARDVESKLTTISVVSSASATKTFTSGTALSLDGNTFTEASGVYTVSPWKTVAGVQNLAVAANVASASLGDANTTATHTVDFAPALYKDNEFAMTSKNIKPTIVEEDNKGTILDDSYAGANKFSTELERVVAQGVVKNSADLTAGIGTQGAFTTLGYSGSMGAKYSFLYADNAGTRKMEGTPASAMKYTGLKSAIHDNDNATMPTDFSTQPYVGADDVTTTSGTSRPLVASTVNIGAGEDALAAAGYYFLENSQAGTTFGRARNAYATIYAKLEPKTVYKLADNWKFVEESGTGQWFKVEKDAGSGAITKVTPALSTDTGAVEGKIEGGVQTGGTLTNGDFFLGTTTNRYYDSLNAARADGNTKTKLYKGGKMVYATPWNQIKNDAGTTTVYADTRRNNIYLINVTEFSKIGDNYDPNNPNDPNVPKPEPGDNPDEPTPPNDEGPWDETDTYMKITAKVLQWNSVTRDVKF